MSILTASIEEGDVTHDVEVLTPRDAFEAFDEIERRGLKPTVTILDPWHNKGVGGVMSDADYDAFIAKLLVRACAISAHVYLWDFPEIIGPYVRQIPASHGLVAWLTWYYKNNPSVIRGWRSSQMACLHLARPDAPLYPDAFLNQVQKERLKAGTLRYMPGPTSVIESALLIGFIGKDEQTGHPSQKPVAVYDKLIRMVTVEGDLIFDPFCGSGATGAVAKIRCRRAILSDATPTTSPWPPPGSRRIPRVWRPAWTQPVTTLTSLPKGAARHPNYCPNPIPKAPGLGESVATPTPVWYEPAGVAIPVATRLKSHAKSTV